MSSTSKPPALTWQVASAIPGRMRLRHDAIADRARAHRIEAELSATHGVIRAEARPLTSGLLVRYDPAAISRRQLLHVLEDLVAPLSGPPTEPVGHLPAARFALANGSLALAAVGELALPALLPASAVLLVASSLRVIREAWREVRRRTIGLPVLYTTILTGTLLSGQFLAASLMAWMYQFWRHRHRVAQHDLRRRLLPSLTQRPRFARLCVGGAEVEVPADRLHEGDRIVVEEGEMVPADGWLAGGFAVVDERPVRGLAGLTRKQAGDPVFAGSFAAEGRLFLEVLAPGASTRAERLGRELSAAVAPPPGRFSLTAPGEAFARRAVGPTLAAAGFGLAIGDLATASAILRPDYATGPGLGASLETLRDVATSAIEGVVIRDASAFRRLAEADVFLFDDHPILERPGLEVRAVERLDGLAEDEVLRLAASAFAGLADERSSALNAACASRRTVVRRDVRPCYSGLEITLTDRTRSASIRELRGDGSAPSSTPPDLEVAADGRPVGRIAFGPSPAPRAAESLRALRQAGPVTIGLLSHRPDPEAAALAGSLGMDFHLGGLSAETAAEAVRTCRRQGRKVVYIGDSLRHPEAAREADLAISLADPIDPARDPAQVLVLRPDLDWAAGLTSRARAHVGRLRTLHSLILVPNLACVAGAFLLGFTSLSAVLLTNLGTLAIYSGVAHRPHPALPSRRTSRT